MYDTFLSTRLINAHTNETVEKRHLDIRITHRFDDVGGVAGGIDNLYGLDNVTDIRIGLEYGLTDALTLGFGRSKGVAGGGPTKLLDGFAKFRLLKQSAKESSVNMPLSLTLFANTAYSTQAADTINLTSPASFRKGSHRLSYDFQLIIARKFSDRFSIQLMPNYLHRNLVEFGDENGIFSLGVAGRIAIAKHYAIIFDYYQLFSNYRSDINAADESVRKFYMPLGIGLEIKTGGHVFHLNFSNSRGILENQYIPYTNKNWLDGGFRLGFNISRPVKI